MTIRAIYENGVFRPVEPVNLPERAEVEVVLPESPADQGGLAKIYSIMGERYASGHSDTAERHDEHQP